MANIKEAKQFVKDWAGRGDEKQDTQRFWTQLLGDVFGVNVRDRGNLDFERPVVKSTLNAGYKDVVVNNGYPDNPELNAGYNCNRVLIEQKGIQFDLDKPEPRSGKMVTPFEQAKEYDNVSPKQEKADWIITCNFREFWIYDMSKDLKELREPVKLKLEDLPKHLDWLSMLENHETEHKLTFTEEVDVSVKAGKLVGLLYDELRQRYIEPDSEETQKQLNILCVRLVFCLYAEDAGLFNRNNRKVFHDYLAQFDAKGMRTALANLFEVLDKKEVDRDPYLSDDNELLASFPYVNGGLFHGVVVIPPFTDATREMLLDKASMEFDWSKISPTIFGAVFESTLNPDARRQGGMHYTSIENIHKVIDPLFLEDLKEEFEQISNLKQVNVRNTRIEEFQNKLASLKFLDPAAGSGNFLTETYLSLRRLENDCLRLKQKGANIGLALEGEANPIKVSIQQMYGIEINDFAVSVARTALWIAEAQMFEETQIILNGTKEFLPLKEFNNIVEGNALHLNWNEVLPSDMCSYIMGNPPFLGQSVRDKEQSNDMSLIFGKGASETKLDYVICWYKKSIEYMQGAKIQSAFVSTNSICQGESVPTFWKLMNDLNCEIQFAHRTFIWDSEAISKAHVHCVIIGFTAYKDNKTKYIYDGLKKISTNHINSYLLDAPDIWIENRTNIPPKGKSKMTTGSPPTDDGGLTMTVSEKNKLVQKYPILEQYIKPFIGAREFLHDEIGSYSRYCLWLVDANPSDYIHIPEIQERLQKVKAKRLESNADRINKMAEFPSLFCQNRQPKETYLVFPRHSSENRKYIPIGFMDSNIIVGDACSIIPNTTLDVFGILTSNVHMAWMRIVCGRLKSDFRYSPSTYNNFPFKELDEKNVSNIKRTAKLILDARSKYPNSCLADLYDPLTMPIELLKAHQANDKAVMDAYGFSQDMEDSEIVSKLFEMYQEFVDASR